MAETILNNPRVKGNMSGSACAEIDDALSMPSSQDFSAALVKEGIRRMCAIYDIICGADPQIGNMSFTNDREDASHYTFPR